MTRKTLAKLILAGLALGGSQMALACQTTNWTGGEQGSPIEGEPDDAIPVSRYSGRCGLRSNAFDNYVRDISPLAEPQYRARFYVFTGVTAGTGDAIVFRASEADGTVHIRVGYNTAANEFRFYVGGTNDVADGVVAGAADNRWYAIELNFSNSTPELRYTVQGAGSGTPLATNVATSVNPAGGDFIDTAELGWVANLGGTPTGQINVDAFDSRRASAIGRLCRGDANNDGNRNSGDATQARIEFLSAGNPPTPTFQPDCNEDGRVDSGDATCARITFLAGNGPCATGT